MPLGAPSHTVPKSGWSPRDPHDAMSWADAGSTGSPDTSAFHALSAGNGRRPSRLAFAPGAGVFGSPTPLAEHDIVTTTTTQPSKAAAPRGKASARDSAHVEHALRMLDVVRAPGRER